MAFRSLLKNGIRWRVVAPSSVLLVAGGYSFRAETQSLSSFRATEKPFDPSGERYDQDEYMGRVRTMFERINPANLLVSDTELRRCQDLLAAHKAGTLPPTVTDSDLWAAKSTVDAVLHPDTKEKMFAPGRMSGFLLANIPICAGMLMHGPTSAAAAAFWQWVNQSYNVVCNYTNRSGESLETSALMQSYGLAVAASIAIAMGAAKMIKTYPSLSRFGIFIPYTAVVVAGSCNLAFTRMGEIRNGIPVFDAENVPQGVSQTAGQLAVFETLATRCFFLPIVPLLVPPLAMTWLKKNASFAKNRPLVVVMELGLIMVCFGIALPFALALRPQKMTIPASSLEPRFHNLADKKGNKIDNLYANRGL